MAEKPSQSLEIPRLLKAQYIAGIALSLLYLSLALITLLFSRESIWISLTLLLAFTHSSCTWSLLRILKKKIYAGTVMRITMMFTILCNFIIMVVLYHYGTIQHFERAHQLTKIELLTTAFIVHTIALQAFPLLSFIYSFTHTIKSYLHYLTLYDGEFL